MSTATSFFRVAAVALCFGLIAAEPAHAQRWRQVRESHATQQTNAAAVSQRGSGNGAAVVQNGQGNDAAIRQIGSGNTGAITQNGNDNTGCLIQVGRNLDGAIVQNGNGQTTAVLQNRGGAHALPGRVCNGSFGGMRVRG